jgi:hypothetical protein
MDRIGDEVIDREALATAVLGGFKKVKFRFRKAAQVPLKARISKIHRAPKKQRLLHFRNEILDASH